MIYTLIVIILITIFFMLTNTSDRKINKKIEKTLGFQEVSYREKFLTGIDEGVVPLSENLKVKVERSAITQVIAKKGE